MSEHVAFNELAEAELFWKNIDARQAGSTRYWGLSILLAEYDRRGAELDRLAVQRDAVLAIADELDREAPTRPSAPVLVARLHTALGAES